MKVFKIAFRLERNQYTKEAVRMPKGKTKSNTQLQAAIDACNPPTLTELARRIGVSPQAVHQWLAAETPVERCRDVERACAKKVTRAQLRPDHFGD